MKKLLLFILLFISGYAIAGHVAGGEIFYTYLGKGVANGTSKYKITLRLFRECNPIAVNGQGLAQLPDYVYLGIYKNTEPTQEVGSLVYVPRKGGLTILNLSSYNPCLVEKIPVCYQLGIYEFEQDLPDIAEGYTVGYQTCCRSFSIVNVHFPPLSNTLNAEGATYSCQIPGTNLLGSGINSSPVFSIKDTTLVCANDHFTLDMSASDPDMGDSLSYSLCSAFNRGRTTGAADTNYLPPPYYSVSYLSPYSGSSPLGNEASIDPITGIISGIAPEAGAYVINVCVTEWRKGVPIGIHRKDFTLKVASCTLSAAKLRPSYANCNSFSFKFSNESTSPFINKYLWNFGDSLSSTNIDSVSPTPVHIYADTGGYKFSLTVFSKGANGICVDSAKSIVKVYPGFHANFVVKSSCIKNPYSFIDSSFSKYGSINSWSWDLGETSTTNDIFSVKDTSYIYPTPGFKTVKLTVGNSTGCTADTSIVVTVRENPLLYLPFHDTVICNVDSVKLFSSEVNPSGLAKFRWTPADSVSNDTISNPIVHPKKTLTYHLYLTDQGCFANDTVRVNTVSAIAVKIEPSDTLLCQKDSIILYALTKGEGYTWTRNNLSDGLRFSWTSNNPNEKIEAPNHASPYIKSTANPTKYTVKVNLGNICYSESSNTVSVYPYPIISAGVSDSICYGNSKTLIGSISKGATYKWTPINSLIDSTSLNPIATPDSTTQYTLTAHYTGKNVCPKPISDTVTITVIPKVIISAGNDTTVVVNEPLHLAALGNVDSTNATFLWTTTNTPQLYLDKNNIYNPTAIVTSLTIDSITYVVTAIQNNVKKCSATDTLRVLVYQTLPQIFVPTVFTPNSFNGSYKTEKPVPVGVLRLDFFRVFNREGKLLFTTSTIGDGWDGNYNGEAQPSGTYIYETRGLDYKGIKTLYNKGTFVLIR